MPKKYLDFVEGASELRPAKLPPYEPREYISLTCPHCKIAFVSLPVENIKSQKAGECLKHLRGGPEFHGDVVPAPEKKHKDPAFADLMERVQGLESTVASQGATIASHESVFDVLVNEYGMFRPITDETVRPQIKMLIDKSCSPSTAVVTASDAERMRQQQEALLVQKDNVIAEQKQLLAQKDVELSRANAELGRAQAMVKRIQEEREAIETKLRSQLKRDRCGTSKSLLAQAEQSHKACYSKSLPTDAHRSKKRSF